MPPLSKVCDSYGEPSDMNSFGFHTSYYDNSRKKTKKLIGWAHPVLLGVLRHNKSWRFIDGICRCVPTKFNQCIVFMVYEHSTLLYLPAAFVLCSSKTHDMYFHAI